MNDLSKYNRPGIYVQETDIGYITPDGGYFCSQCYEPNTASMPVDKSHCLSCGEEVTLITLTEVIKIQRNEKIDKLI